jgi:hypothetical protein
MVHTYYDLVNMIEHFLIDVNDIADLLGGFVVADG